MPYAPDWPRVDAPPLPTLGELRRFLSDHGLDRPHEERSEPLHDGGPALTWQHQGYEAVLCAICEKPFLRGVGFPAATCERPGCVAP